MTKRDLALIALTVVITSAIFMGYNYLATNGTGNTFSFDKSSKLSERIKWADAKKMKNEYQAFKPLLTDDPSNQTKFVPLEGFRFKASDIKEIVNDIFPGNIQADEVVFYLGQNGKKGGFAGIGEHGVIHIIAVGSNNNKLLLAPPMISFSKNLTGEPCIFDKADPCPPNPVE